MFGIKRKISEYFFKKHFPNDSYDMGIKKQNRDIWLKSALEKVPAGSRILDAGAGELRYKKFCDHLKYVSQDFAQYEGVGDKKGLQTGTWDQTKLDIISDITEIPELDGSFDAIMCIEVFEHLPDPALAIKEFSRLLKPGSQLIITAPFCSLTHFAPYHFGTGYNTYYYEHHLKKNGFEVLEIDRNGNYFSYLSQELVRVPAVIEKYSENNGSVFQKKVRNYAVRVLLDWMNSASKKDKGSEGLLCFGINVRAIKK